MVVSKVKYAGVRLHFICRLLDYTFPPQWVGFDRLRQVREKNGVRILGRWIHLKLLALKELTAKD